MNYNQFYISKGEYCMLLFETREAAMAVTPQSYHARVLPASNSSWHADHAERLGKQINSKVFVVGVTDVIFIVKREKRYWYVIAGDKFGWIKATDWPTYLKELNINENTKQ